MSRGSVGIVICGCPPAVGTQWSGCNDVSDVTYEGFASTVQGPNDFGAGFEEYWVQIRFSDAVTSAEGCNEGFVVMAGGQQVPDGRFFVVINNSLTGTLSWDAAYGFTLDSWSWDGQGDCLVDSQGLRLAAFQGGGVGPG